MPLSKHSGTEYVSDWAIENFSCFQANRDLRSPVFFDEELQEMKFYFSINYHIKYKNNNYSNPTGCRVTCQVNQVQDSKQSKSLPISCEIAFVDSNDSILFLNKGYFVTHVFNVTSSGTKIDTNDTGNNGSQDIFRVRCRMWADSQSPQSQFYCRARTVIFCERGYADWTLKLSDKGFVTVTPATSTGKSQTVLNMEIYPRVHCDGFLKFIVDLKGSEVSSLLIVTVYLLEEGKHLKLLNAVRKKRCEIGSQMKFDFNVATNPVKSTWNDIVCATESRSSSNALGIRTQIVNSYGNVASSEIERTERVYGKEKRIPTMQRTVASPPTDFASALWSMREDSNLCDSNLVTRTGSFPVHRVVLAVRSEVFRAMFSTDMLEKNGGDVQVPDLDDATVSHLLRYAYTGCVQMDWGAALGLLYAADKYRMSDLLDMCSDYIESQLSMDNIYEAVVASETHGHERLRDIVMSFVYARRSEIPTNQNWKQLEVDHPEMALKVFNELLV